MRATEVIATHGNTDFDAFAAMLAARRLYPDAIVCVPGTLNKNVKEFYRLHADELEAVEASRLALDAVRRLIVVETQHASRLGELEQVVWDIQENWLVGYRAYEQIPGLDGTAASDLANPSAHKTR